MLKKLCFPLASLGICCLFLTIYYWQFVISAPKVIFCDVGQGDATLIIDGFYQVLVDGGRDERVLDCLEKYLPAWDREIDLVIVSHADSDHIGGFEMVLNRYFVKEMLVSEYGTTTGVFKGFRNAVLREIEEGMTLNLAVGNSSKKIGKNISLKNYFTRVRGFSNNPFMSVKTETTLWDKINEQNQIIKDKKLDLNALSIVTFLQLNSTKFLLMGDLDVLREQALVEQGLITDVDILKVGHHGSKTSTSDTFLKASAPEIATISVGYNNSYGLPSPQVVNKIKQFGIRILRTDESGDLVVEVSKNSYATNLD
ncbi:MBL fold metallo-hydrolase [Patescibacteria group bacterium]|nr:MBL fold metallo-hydrolase [Patescibacteria group bacterium]